MKISASMLVSSIHFTTELYNTITIEVTVSLSHSDKERHHWPCIMLTKTTYRTAVRNVFTQMHTTRSQSPSDDRPVELHCQGTVPVEQFFGCSKETGYAIAHFQVTSQGLSVPHLMCWWTEGTSTTAWCCGVFRDSGVGYKTADLVNKLLQTVFVTALKRSRPKINSNNVFVHPYIGSSQVLNCWTVCLSIVSCNIITGFPLTWRTWKTPGILLSWRTPDSWNFILDRAGND